MGDTVRRKIVQCSQIVVNQSSQTEQSSRTVNRRTVQHNGETVNRRTVQHSEIVNRQTVQRSKTVNHATVQVGETVDCTTVQCSQAVDRTTVLCRLLPHHAAETIENVLSATQSELHVKLELKFQNQMQCTAAIIISTLL